MDSKRVIVTALVTVVGVGGIISGAILLKDRQDIRERAAVPNGKAEVTFSPTSGTFDVGETFPVSIYFNTGNDTAGYEAISGLSVRVTYPYSGATPEVSASNVQVSSGLLASGDWSCPTSTVTESGGVVNIDIACANVSASGFTATTDTLLATFDLTVNRAPSTSPFTIRFDPSNSVATSWRNGEDILALPQSEGTYAIGGENGGENVPTATATPSPLPTGNVSVTTTTTTTPTLSPTETATTPSSLPDAGFSLPTVAGLGLGMLAVFASLALTL